MSESVMVTPGGAPTNRAPGAMRLRDRNVASVRKRAQGKRRLYVSFNRMVSADCAGSRVDQRPYQSPRASNAAFGSHATSG